jgi:hypothetical protein
MNYGNFADDIACVWTDPDPITAWTGWNNTNRDIRATYFTPSIVNPNAV